MKHLSFFEAFVLYNGIYSIKMKGVPFVIIMMHVWNVKAWGVQSYSTYASIFMPILLSSVVCMLKEVNCATARELYRLRDNDTTASWYLWMYQTKWSPQLGIIIDDIDFKYRQFLEFSVVTFSHVNFLNVMNLVANIKVTWEMSKFDLI